ncbi:hypothetical protein FM107_06605 [Sphingobacterium sp. JB170]|nr:hypothetical protein FM107_06605 [Sphingobacterium sp. JB170]
MLNKPSILKKSRQQNDGNKGILTIIINRKQRYAGAFLTHTLYG